MNPVELVRALLAAGPLLSALPQPVRVRSGDPGLGALAERLGLPPITPVGDVDGLGPFERVLSAYLDLAEPVAVSAADVEAARAQDFDAWASRVVVRAPDGAELPAYAAGDRTKPAVVIVPAPGMPARLCEGWMRPLARDHFVLVWETRGLFTDHFTGAVDVPAQVDDLFALLDHFELDQAHVLGLCGGAVLGVVAAAREPERVSSLSLWHGDFDLGDESPKTDHQRNLQALMAMAARGTDKAAGVHAVLAHTMLGVTPPRLAHLVVYPYATPELLHLYCRLNGEIMATDLRPYLPDVPHRTLVVTSEDDETAHPAGSHAVAGRLADATLHVTAHGDHLSLFRAEEHLVELAVRFIDART
ncbi:pimeloyl-ACP methyl ester carboxylesterase [Saccharothrix tamanrassetensis]|uniref:Pimeloyl-ACP methyl ester carboxylesterase n=1 Tax=Saccharothrix tamanrassetensis TaxID=1051531 RepID=A0A841C8N2_9PSEU|nr:alpha/beta hydrolase [Saccharothrix tamanrassetensis]MBB5953769.1 pimeloyl-ACP methyl ester carboxylesterase [Saccharothrix tamanrassetensis]